MTNSSEMRILTLDQCREASSRLADFLAEHSDLISGCMVDFITKDIFEQSWTRNQTLRDELASLSDEDLCDLPTKFHEFCDKNKSGSKQSKSGSALNELLKRMSDHMLDALGVVSSDQNLFLESNNDKYKLLEHFDRFMSDKKMHEVVVMARVVSTLSADLGIGGLVDVGSGKAYLSQVVAVLPENHDLRVLAIDSSSGNQRGAEKRSANLEKQWEALFRRAACRAGGEVPPRRGKHWRSTKNNDNNMIKDDEANNDQEVEVAEANHVNQNLRYDTLFVDTTTELQALMRRHFPDQDQGRDFGRLGIMGLHTCGNLAADSLKIYLANPAMMFCVNVGCCYHHLDEEFYTNPNLPTDTVKPSTTSFPLSSVLKARMFKLGRNARMLAAQPMDRLVTNKKLPSESLLWRAILQHLLLQHRPDLAMADQHVGRIAAKSVDFNDYVAKSFGKLGIELKMSPDEIKSTYDSFRSSHGRKLNAFYQLRSLFAPLIEGLILLDRLTFLLENRQEAHLVKLFDAYISPRCYALIAIKKRSP